MTNLDTPNPPPEPRPLHVFLRALANHFGEPSRLHAVGGPQALVEPLARAADIVQAHETGERIAQVFDLHTHTFKPQTVQGCAMVERERTGELVAIPRRIYDELEDRLCERVGQIRHAQAVTETLWHTLNRIAALQSSDYEHSDAGELASYRARVRHLADRRLMLIPELPADETVSDGAWLGKIGPSDDLEELAELRKQAGYLPCPEHGVHSFPSKPCYMCGWRPEFAAAEEAPKERSNREAAHTRLQAVLDKAPLSASTCPEDVYSDLLDASHAAASALREPLWIAQRIERLHAWTRVAGFAAGNGADEEDLAAVRADLAMTAMEREELADLRVQTGVADAQLCELGGKLDQIAEMISPGVRDTRVDDGKDHSWKAPDTVELVREFVARRGVFPPELVLRASMLAMALEQVGDDGAGPTTTADAAKLLFEIVRVADRYPELVNARFVDVSWTSDPDRTVLRFEGLPDIAVPDADVDSLVSEYMTKSPVRAARVMMQQSTAKAPRLPYYLPASTRTELHGAAGEGMVTIITNAAGEIAQVTCHDVGPEPEDEDGDHEETLAARCKVTSDNLSALLGPIGGETQVPEPLWSGVVTASILLDEVANVLRKRSRLFWIVDEYNDNEGETFGIAIPSSPEVDAALEKWARSFDAIVCTEQGRAPLESPFEQMLGSGTTIAFRRHETSDDLQAIERVSDNNYSSRLRLLKPEGVEVLLKAISVLPDGGSLSLYKGSLSTCFADESASEPEDVADLWKFCDEDMFGEGEGLGDHHHPDDMALGEDDEDMSEPEEAFQAQRDEENLRDHEDFARRTDPPNQHIELGNGLAFISAPASTIQNVVTPNGLAAHYFRAGWDLGVQVDGSTTHLLADRDGHRGEGGTACGDLVKVEFIKPLSDALDFPEHPRLCGRCCATANDRRGETVT